MPTHDRPESPPATPAPRLDGARRERVRERLRGLYGDAAADRCLTAIDGSLARHRAVADPARERWSERDVVLISYGDTLRRDGERPLRTLKRFADARLGGVVSAIHVLPFFPWSSDDGFSVIDHRAVDPALGDWDDVRALGERFRLGIDLVLNHASARGVWFRQYLAGEGPGRDYFVEADPDADLSAVVRPRSLPLRTRVETAAGPRHVWTTFSADQVDLDFRNPDVLAEFVDIALQYVAAGAWVLRLDAVAFLWKRIGTSCLHLPETHEVVKLLRDVVECASPGAIVLTETNVPHADNVSYFGDGDEARMVYQFSLPPLLLHALTTGDARALSAWAAALDDPPPGCTFLEFTASHDGIGVRPLEGLVPDGAIAALAERVRAQGGHVSTRRQADGSDAPYELNIPYLDALAGDDGDEAGERALERFLCSQTIALMLRGVPAIYVHSLLGSRGWHEGVQQTGRARTINRRVWDADEIERRLDDPRTHHHRVFHELVRRIRVRTACPAFHPDAGQRVLALGPELFGVVRTPLEGDAPVICVANVTDATVRVSTAGWGERPEGGWGDLLGRVVVEGDEIELEAYRVIWLARSS